MFKLCSLLMFFFFFSSSTIAIYFMMLLILSLYGLLIWMITNSSFFSFSFMLLVLGGLMIVFSFIPMVEYSVMSKNSFLSAKVVVLLCLLVTPGVPLTTLKYSHGVEFISLFLKDGFVSILLFLVTLFFIMLIVVDMITNTSEGSMLAV
uniref:NADH dehydrogenase subunit 6 n=1 Tax=Ibidoecus plataleae TaxID=3004258 RepID=A0A9E9IZI2_9NEOP|nr:NADH dehydrogenase subunit 6 [Ibidoecus plataleae]